MLENLKCTRCHQQKPKIMFLDNKNIIRKRCKSCREINLKWRIRTEPIKIKKVKPDFSILPRWKQSKQLPRLSIKDKHISTIRCNLKQIFNSGLECCVICSSTQNLCTDHNHKTGFIRGRLCNSCNVGIGCFKDSSELLLKARNFILEENLEKLKVKHQPGKCYMFYKSFVDKCIENIKLGFEYGK